MIRIFKLSAYLVDTDAFGCFSTETLKNQIVSWAINKGYRCVRHLHIEQADISSEDFSNIHPDNCDLSYCEKHFQKQKSVAEYDRPIPKPGEHWMHFKVGKLVEIVAVSRCSENPDSFSVIYRDPNGIVWDRPLDMFMSEVDHEKYPNVLTKYRFEKVITSHTVYSDTVEHYE